MSSVWTGLMYLICSTYSFVSVFPFMVLQCMGSCHKTLFSFNPSPVILLLALVTSDINKHSKVKNKLAALCILNSQEPVYVLSFFFPLIHRSCKNLEWKKWQNWARLYWLQSALWWTGNLLGVYLSSCQITSGIGFTPCDPIRISSIADWWMDTNFTTFMHQAAKQSDRLKPVSKTNIHNIE